MLKTELSDSCLVSLYTKGNEEALSVLIDRHKSRIFTTIYFIVKDKYIAEDLLQDVFIKTIKTIKCGKYNEQGKFLSWIVRVAHNQAIDHFRKEKRNPRITLKDGSDVFNCLKFSEDFTESNNLTKETVQYIKKIKSSPPNHPRFQGRYPKLQQLQNPQIRL